IRAIKPTFFLVLHYGPYPITVLRGNGYADDAQGIFREPFVFGNFGPSFATIGTFPKGRSITPTTETVWGALHSPSRGVQNSGIVGVEGEIHGTCHIVHKKNLLP